MSRLLDVLVLYPWLSVAATYMFAGGLLIAGIRWLNHALPKDSEPDAVSASSPENRNATHRQKDTVQ